MGTIVTNVQELVAAREARGLGQGDIAQTLKLAPRQVVALEAGDWAALPGLAFVRGALRGYGRLLGADVEALLQSVSGLDAPTGIEPATSLRQPMPRRSMLGFGAGGGGNWLAWAALVIAGVVVLAFFFVRDGDGSRISSWLGRSAPVDATAPGPNGAPAGDDRAAPGVAAAATPAAPEASPPAAGQPTPSASSGTRVEAVPIPVQDAGAAPASVTPAAR